MCECAVKEYKRAKFIMHVIAFSINTKLTRLQCSNACPRNERGEHVRVAKKNAKKTVDYP